MGVLLGYRNFYLTATSQSREDKVVMAGGSIERGKEGGRGGGREGGLACTYRSRKADLSSTG